jgi:NTP pyrophosphatase (non-canonical NTP hydrolase)
MNAKHYQQLAMVTANPELSRELKLVNGALGLSGESGEVADLIKKHLMQGHPLDQDKIEGELGDVLWYIALMCSTLGVDMGDIMTKNIFKLKSRYGDKFSKERSIEREV